MVIMFMNLCLQCGGTSALHFSDMKNLFFLIICSAINHLDCFARSQSFKDILELSFYSTQKYLCYSNKDINAIHLLGVMGPAA